MDGLEHKDERLYATEGSGWQDKLARLRDELTAGDPADETDETDGADDDVDGIPGAVRRVR